jgi:radical SAM superfamily enzyme YgiQ (UPF0313 family)
MNSPRVVLIIPPSDCVDNDRLEPPLGLLYLASTLRQRSYTNLRLHDMSGSPDEHLVTDQVNSIPEAEVYGISVMCTNHNFARRCVQNIRRRWRKAFIVAGGPNPSAMPKHTLKDLNVDAVVIGEGDDAFADLIDAHLAGHPTQRIFEGRGRSDIDSYPYPARDLFIRSTYGKRLLGNPTVSMITSRGCPNRCLHCNSNVMGAGNRQPRYRSTDNILSEIRQLQSIGWRFIRFTDDNFTSNPNLLELLDGLSRCNIRFRVFARLTDLSDRNCRALQKAGCVHIAVGLESLNPDNLRTLGKGDQIDQTERLHVAKQAGLTIRCSFMVGLPHDSHTSIERDFSQAAKLPFDEFEVIPIIPYPGTRLAKTPQKWGYRIIEPDFTSYVLIGKNRQTTYALCHERFSAEDMSLWRRRAEQLLTADGKRFMKESEIAQ